MTMVSGAGEPIARHLRGPTRPRHAEIMLSIVRVFHPPLRHYIGILASVSEDNGFVPPSLSTLV